MLGRRAASTGFSYSQALQASGLTWDEANLDRFLENPGKAVPGTTMPVAVPDKADRADIIGYLKTLRPSAPPAVAQEKLAQPALATSKSGDWRDDRPGLRHKITVADLPPPYQTRSVSNPPSVVRRPANARPLAPAGFDVQLLLEGLDDPRVIRVAPNGDLFIAESSAGRVRILQLDGDGKTAMRNEVFASGLNGPFGIAFYPEGPEPEWVYVAEVNRVVRFPYKTGDRKARAEPEVIVPRLSPTSGGHVKRDIAFSKDGSRMFVSAGSASNVAQGMPPKGPRELARWDAERAPGAAWGFEENRANVLVFTPEGKNGRVFAAGIRNCVGLAVHPTTGDVYCSANERDGLGDDLVPDYVTRVREHAFYGWPWWYIGDHQDPRWKNARPDLLGKITVPDVLLQAHSASLGLAFYDGTSFPAEYRGSGFAAFHGSWNRSTRTGYKVVRIIIRDGVPTGEYEDFLTGFVIGNERVWGRPVGLAMGKDGSLYVSEDGNGTIWRVTYDGKEAVSR